MPYRITADTGAMGTYIKIGINPKKGLLLAKDWIWQAVA